MPEITFQHSSMQFSDSKRHHDKDAAAVWTPRNDIVTGTEAGSNDLAHSLPVQGSHAGYQVIVATHSDVWVGVRNWFGSITDHGYIEVIPAVHGPASQGGHMGRGILWVEVEAHDRTIGTVVVGVAHWLTAGAAKADHESNKALERAFGKFAKDQGKGARLVFAAGDTNIHDGADDVFGGIAPLTTCWDELGHHPATHMYNEKHGTCIDVIASYNADKRSVCHSAKVLDDTALPLFSDHFTIEATYSVKPR